MLNFLSHPSSVPFEKNIGLLIENLITPKLNSRIGFLYLTIPVFYQILPE